MVNFRWTGYNALILLAAMQTIPRDYYEAALIDGAGLKPRDAFGPLRTAVSGRRISPPLFESMEILGKSSTIARLNRFLASL